MIRQMIFLFLGMTLTCKVWSQVAGSYQFNPDPAHLFILQEKNGKWILRGDENPRQEIGLTRLPDGKYQLDGIQPASILQFNHDTMQLGPNGAVKAVRISAATDFPVAKRVSNRKNGFTRADTLRGMLSPLRSCYDVTYYHLTVDIDPVNRMVAGNSLIRFRTMQSFRQLQIDLYENMVIDSIIYRHQTLFYTREFDAVFVTFPHKLPQGAIDEIRVFYHGRPQEPDRSVPMNGGFVWRQDENGKPFIQVICQGSGASLWWPNKDHLSDKADSVLLTVTVPAGLQNISNGRLRRQEAVPGNKTLTEWFVSYPINNYNVNVCIGDFRHFSDVYVRKGDTLTLDYYCLPYHLDRAKALAPKVKPMLAEFEKHFGPYPFPRDGFKLLETLHPMEHQSAVGLGPFIQDTTELSRLLWHEAAHEWWGNNVSCKDVADFWLHEGFATYSEKMMIGSTYGPEAALNALKAERPANREPVIGVRDVNHIFYPLWDVYSKGCRVIHTLRSVMNNDVRFFSILRGIQQQFRYKTVTTYDIVDYISRQSHLDLTAFFNQYLIQTKVPELQVMFQEQAGGLLVRYRWNDVVAGFRMPVKVTLNNGQYAFIHPDGNWKQLLVKGLKQEAFKVDQDNFYVKMKEVK